MEESNSTFEALQGLQEPSSFSGSFLTILLAFAALSLFYWSMTASDLDPREPPLAKSKIPFIGHLIGMLRYQIKYMEMIK